MRLNTMGTPTLITVHLQQHALWNYKTFAVAVGKYIYVILLPYHSENFLMAYIFVVEIT